MKRSIIHTLVTVLMLTIIASGNLKGQDQKKLLYVSGTVSSNSQMLVSVQDTKTIKGKVVTAEINGKKTEARTDKNGHAILDFSVIAKGLVAPTVATIKSIDKKGKEISSATTIVHPGSSKHMGSPVIENLPVNISTNEVMTIQGQNLSTDAQLVCGNQIQETLSASDREMTVLNKAKTGEQQLYVKTSNGISESQKVNIYALDFVLPKSSISPKEKVQAMVHYESIPVGTKLIFTNQSSGTIKMSIPESKVAANECIYTISEKNGTIPVNVTGITNGNFLINLDLGFKNETTNLIQYTTLLSPSNNSKLNVKDHIIFDWAPTKISPAPKPGDLSYTLKIVEVQKKQSIEDAVKNNHPIYIKDSITGTTVKVPLLHMKVDSNKTYAWSIIPYLFKNPYAPYNRKFDIFTFTLPLISLNFCSSSNEWKAGPSIKIVKKLDYYPKNQIMRPGDVIGISLFAVDNDFLLQNCICGNDLDTRKFIMEDRISYDWNISSNTGKLYSFDAHGNSALFQLPFCVSGEEKSTITVKIENKNEKKDDVPIDGIVEINYSEDTNEKGKIKVTVTITDPIINPDEKLEEKHGLCCKVSVPLKWDKQKGINSLKGIEYWVTDPPPIPDNHLVLLNAFFNDNDDLLMKCKTVCPNCMIGPGTKLTIVDPCKYVWDVDPNHGEFPLGNNGPVVVFKPKQGEGLVKVKCTISDSKLQAEDQIPPKDFFVEKPPLKPIAYVILSDVGEIAWQHVWEASQNALNKYKSRGYDSRFIWGQTKIGEVESETNEGANLLNFKAVFTNPYARAITVIGHGHNGYISTADQYPVSPTEVLTWIRNKWGENCQKHPYLYELINHTCYSAMSDYQMRTWPLIMNGVFKGWDIEVMAYQWKNYEKNIHNPPKAKW